MGGTGGEEIEYEYEERGRRSVSAEPILQKKPSDPRYGPGFERVSKYQSRPLSAGGSGLELVGIKEPELRSHTVDYVGKKTEEACQRYEEYVEKKAMDQSFMEADTVDDFLKHQANIQHMRELADRKKEYKPLYNDTSYVRALGDVQKRVKESGKYEGMQKPLDDINIFYRRRRVPSGLACTRARHCLILTLVTPRCIVNSALLFKIFRQCGLKYVVKVV